jgi:HTH-like domain
MPSSCSTRRHGRWLGCVRGWKAVVAAFTPMPSGQAAPWRDHDEVALLTCVKAIHAETRQSYGSRRMAKQLQADGFPVGRYKARHLMQEAGVAVRHRKRYPVFDV